jgi:zinc/manganese transport system permease protein
MSGLYSFLVAPFESFGFMRTALAACLAFALVNGVIGTFLLLRRMSLEGDVLSHAIMPGAALGFLYSGYSLTALSLGGLATGILVLGLSGLAARLAPRQAQNGLTAFYLASLATGVLIVSLRGSNVDLVRVLFGTVLALDFSAVVLIATISSVTLLIMAAIYRALAAETFDPGFVAAMGARGGLFRVVFVLLVMINLVAGFQAFGTLLAVGPMVLPAAAARCLSDRIGPCIGLAIVIGLVADYAGLLISYYGNLPSGPAIVVAGAAIYGVSLMIAALRDRVPQLAEIKP